MLATNQKQFNDAYIASKPLEVQALFSMGSDEARAAKGQELAYKYLLCKRIDINNGDPWTVMLTWLDLGYTWMPSALQDPLTVAPGLNDQHDPPYDPLNPRPGSIKVSIDLDDYPPFVKPVVKPPDPTLSLSPVGALLHDKVYSNKPWDHYPDGAVTGQNGVPADSRGVFTKQLIPNPFYAAAVWNLK